MLGLSPGAGDTPSNLTRDSSVHTGLGRNIELSLLPAIEWAISCGIAAAAFTLAAFTIWWWFQGFDSLGQPGQWLPLPAILTPLVWPLSYFTFIAGVVKSNASLEWPWYYGKIPVAIASFVLELGKSRCLQIPATFDEKVLERLLTVLERR